MNSHLADTLTMGLANALGDHAYQEGREESAAKHFATAAEYAQISGDLNSWANSQRWEGNSLMWAGRPWEALRALVPVASCRDPQVCPEFVYAAMTDVVMLNLFHGPIAVIDKLLAEIRSYLEAMNKESLDHRLDLLHSIRCHLRGEFDEALRLAVRAEKKQRTCRDPGPRYREYSHLRWIARAAFSLGDMTALESVIAATEKCAPCSPLDRQDWHWQRIQRWRLRLDGGMAARGIREHAQAALNAVGRHDGFNDTAFDTGRGLMLGGDLDAISKLRLEEANNWPFQRAVFAFDLEANRFLLAAGRAPVDLDVVQAKPEDKPRPFPASHDSVARLRVATELLRTAAIREAKRLDCDYPVARARRRIAWAESVMPTTMAATNAISQNPPR